MGRRNGTMDGVIGTKRENNAWNEFVDFLLNASKS